MRDLKLMDNKDFAFNMMSLDEELKEHPENREKIFDSRKKIQEAFKSGSNNKKLERLVREHPDKYKLKDRL